MAYTQAEYTLIAASARVLSDDSNKNDPVRRLFESIFIKMLDHDYPGVFGQKTSFAKFVDYSLLNWNFRDDPNKDISTALALVSDIIVGKIMIDSPK